MENLITWVTGIVNNDLSPLENMVILCIIWIAVSDFYHYLFAAVLSWFKKS